MSKPLPKRKHGKTDVAHKSDKAPKSVLKKSAQDEQQRKSKKVKFAKEVEEKEISGTESFSEEEAEEDFDEESEEETDNMEEDTQQDSQQAPNPASSGKDKATQRREAKETKKQRKMSKKGGEVIEKAKSLWEACRPNSLSSEERAPLMSSLVALLKGQFADVLFKHDGSRIVQTVVKYGDKEQRELVAAELAGHFVELAKNKYGKHIVLKLLQFCVKSRDSIIGEFRGVVGKCVRHTEASEVIDTIYSDYCKVRQRNDMMHEFYGNEFVLFARDHAGKTLEDIVRAHPEKKDAIVKRLRAVIDGLLAKERTAIINHSVVHRLILDYVRHEEPGRLKSWLPSVNDTLVEMVHTLDGAKAAVLLVALASAKERKALVKACKPYLAKICSDEYAHFLVLAMCSFVDDTVLLEKTFMAELLQNMPNTIAGKYSRQVLLFLFAGPVGRYFNKDLVDLLRDASILAAETSKKDNTLRFAELRDIVLPALKTALLPRLADAIKQPSTTALCLELMCSGSEDFVNGLSSLLKERPSLLEDEPVRVFMKRLLKRAPENVLQQVCSALRPFRNLLSTEACFALTTAAERNAELRAELEAAAKANPQSSHSAAFLKCLA